MKAEEIAEVLLKELGEKSILGTDEECYPLAVLVSPNSIFDVCKILLEDKRFFFDLLECITGIDNGPEEGAIELVYNLYSIPFDVKLSLKVLINRGTDEKLPSVRSVTELWKSANWMERETFDLVGIYFEDHPDLRRILLPADWKGHPLRKDYSDEEYYHGIKILY